MVPLSNASINKMIPRTEINGRFRDIALLFKMNKNEYRPMTPGDLKIVRPGLTYQRLFDWKRSSAGWYNLDIPFAILNHYRESTKLVWKNKISIVANLLHLIQPIKQQFLQLSMKFIEP